MGIEDIIAKIGSNGSVRAVFLLEGDIYREAIDEEIGISEVSMGMPLVNRALDEVRKKKCAVCVFCDGPLEERDGHLMIMEDKLGNIVGHDVPDYMLDEFKDDPDVVWLCDDFAVFPGKAKTFELVMVMLPRHTTTVGENEGAKDPVLLYPATTTDLILRKRFKMPLDDPSIASAIIAFDMI